MMIDGDDDYASDLERAHDVFVEQLLRQLARSCFRYAVRFGVKCFGVSG